jgi:hypothetical protein
MAAAPGIIFHVHSPNKIVGIFYDIETQLPFFFYGACVPALPMFTATVGVIYKKGDLTGLHSFKGQIGPTLFSLTFDNNPIIEGIISTPFASEASSRVAGAGSWKGAA